MFKFILVAFLTHSCVFAYSAKIEICKECKFSSLDAAWEFVESGDSIEINSGTYIIDNFFIDKSVFIYGVDDPIFISKSGDELFTVLVDSVTIKNLVFKNVTTSYLKERSAIRIAKKSNFLIEGNRIEDCFFGIYIEKSSHGKIINNEIFGNAVVTEAESGNGIHVWHSKYLEIHNNIVTGHRDGIYFEFVNDSKIHSNLSENNNRYGLHFMFSNDDEYYDNTFRNNGVGVAVMFSRRIIMSNNTFEYNWGRASYGLLLKEIYDGTIKGNHFHQNTIGIFVEGSNRIEYQLNTFERNGWAIKFSGGCEDNEISKNNFINNSLDLVINTKLASNSFTNNFWSTYSGYDLDKDGIGDIPHYPVKLFSYILDQVPEAIIMMRSLFVDLINFSEKVSPVFTPKEVKDNIPLMKPTQ